ncbi:hypothetical protein C8J57DRAFT_1288000 [Mycena rebaudengoi]|nr:hypothetical protein C8J57DRAFT_1288000 [Mycena rebaudengoi]
MTGSVWEPSPVPFPFGGAMMCGVVAPLGAPGCGLVPVAHRVWLWGVALVAALGEITLTLPAPRPARAARLLPPGCDRARPINTVLAGPLSIARAFLRGYSSFTYL